MFLAAYASADYLPSARPVMGIWELVISQRISIIGKSVSIFQFHVVVSNCIVANISEKSIMYLHCLLDNLSGLFNLVIYPTMPMMKTTPMMPNNRIMSLTAAILFTAQIFSYTGVHAMFNIMVLHDNLSRVSIAKFLIEEEDNGKFQHI